jgi:hypothetical protein
VLDERMLWWVDVIERVAKGLFGLLLFAFC